MTQSRSASPRLVCKPSRECWIWMPGASFSEKATRLTVEVSAGDCGPFTNRALSKRGRPIRPRAILTSRILLCQLRYVWTVPTWRFTRLTNRPRRLAHEHAALTKAAYVAGCVCADCRTHQRERMAKNR